MTITDEIRRELFSLADRTYREMQLKTIPTLKEDSVIGVRTPALRKLAGQLAKREAVRTFLEELPHRYFEENQLHAFIISGQKDFGTCMEELERFLPFVDNWATCDQMTPRAFKAHRAELAEKAGQWMDSGRPYTVRFGIKTLMDHFLDEAFDPKYPEMAAAVRSEEYYVNMMIAWYFATALAKKYDAVLPVLEQRILPKWTHNKTIQKACESFRVPPERKAYLRTLRV